MKDYKDKMKTSIHVPGPVKPGSQPGATSHNKSSIPGQRLFESKLRAPALRALRTSTPPAGSTQNHEWDPSYGFLSPQLRSRHRILQPTSNLATSNMRGSSTSISYPITNSPVNRVMAQSPVSRVMAQSPMHRALLQDERMRGSPVHLGHMEFNHHNNRFVPVSSYPANVYPGGCPDENVSVCSGDQIYGAMSHRTSSPATNFIHQRTGSPATSVNQFRTGSPATNVNQFRTGSPATNINQFRTGSPAISGSQIRTGSPATIYGSPAAMRQSRSAGYQQTKSRSAGYEQPIRDGQEQGRQSRSAVYEQAKSRSAGYEQSKLLESSVYSRQKDSAAIYDRQERTSNGRTPTLTRNTPLLYKGLLMGPVSTSRPRTNSVSELHIHDNTVDQLADRLSPWTLRNNSADTADGRFETADRVAASADGRWESADSSMEMEWTAARTAARHDNKVSPSSQDGESTLKSDSKSPARRSEIPVLMKSKLKRQAVIVSGQSSPCKQQAISGLSAVSGPSATSSPSRLPAAAATNGQHMSASAQSKLKPRTEFASPKPLLKSTKSSYNSSSEFYGRWESCSPAAPTDYSSPSRLIRAPRDQINSDLPSNGSPARSLYSSRYSSPCKNNLRKDLVTSLSGSPAKDTRHTPKRLRGVYSSSSTPHKYEEVENSDFSYQSFSSPDKYEVVEVNNGVREMYGYSHNRDNTRASDQQSKETRRPATATGGQEASRRTAGAQVADSRRPATAGSAQETRRVPDNRRTEKQVDGGSRRAPGVNQDPSSPFLQYRSRHNRQNEVHQNPAAIRDKSYRNSLDICTEENIYDEPHRLGISERSGGHIALDNQTSRTGDKMVESTKQEEFTSRLIKPTESSIPRIQPKKNSPPGFASQFQGIPLASHRLADGIDGGRVSNDNEGGRLDPLDPTPPGTDASIATTLKKGILWTQRKRIFSRWKEKYYILTPDYLHCFKKSESKMSDMGTFDYKIRLTDIDVIELEDRRGYYTINILLSGEERILLRKPEGIKDWYNTIHQTTKLARERRTEMVSARKFWRQKQLTDSECMQRYVHSRQPGIATRRIVQKGGLSPSSYSNTSTPSPSPILQSSRLTSPASPLVQARVLSPPYMLAAPGGIGVKSPLSATGEIDSGIDSLLTSLSDTSSNYSHRRMISPR